MKEKFSKIIAVSLAVLMVASQAIIPTSAAEPEYYCSVCKEDGKLGTLAHTIAATCEHSGYKIYSCANTTETANGTKRCSGSITVTYADPLPHVGDGNVVEAVAPSCEEDGTVAYERCTGCDCYLAAGTVKELKSIVDPKIDHDYQPTVTGPDCVNGGYTTYVCSMCDDTYVDDEVEANGHDYTVDVPEKPATCREEGYSAHKTCSVCGEIDPENPKTVLPIEDHNGKIVDHQDATCTVDGYNVFKCEKEECPYYDGITETIAALGHDEVEHEAKKATCMEKGYGAYVTCTRCDYTTYDVATEVAALGHSQVSTGFRPATCVADGVNNAIKCDRCGLIHFEGDVIPAKGHTLTLVAAVDPTCTETGSIEHKECSVCHKNFNKDAVNNDPTIKELTNITIPATGHNYDDFEVAPTCTENGYHVYNCEACDHTYSEEISATGHDFEYIEKVAAKCGVEGVEAHNECTVCNNLFAADEDETNIDAVALTEADLVIAALEHVPEVVAEVNPTYNSAGNAAGTKCSLCGEPLQNADEYAELDEAIKFHYVLTGVNGSNTAVNSGYVTLKVYFDVLKDIDDLEAYNSDVLANIFAVDFAMNYDSSVFELTHVAVAPGAFAKAEFTPYGIANENGCIAISQDMVNTSKVFRGENNLFATLTFQVATDAVAADYTFGLDNLYAQHPEEEVIDVSASEQEVVIEVKALGDANGDGIFTSADTFKVSEYIKDTNVEKEYVAEYDMDKDGDIDFIDLDLIRKAIVGNNEYLEITVDPNEVVTPEV